VSRMSKRLLVLLSLCATRAMPAEPGLQGAWGSGLDGYQIVVAGDRACGSWQYLATSSIYDGYFIGKVSNGRLEVLRVCGRPGSTASKWCPGDLDDSAPEETGWTAPDPRYWKPRQVCHGRLVVYDKDAATGQRCPPDDGTSGYPRAEPAEARQRMQDLARAIDTNPDLAACKVAKQGTAR